MPGIGELSGGRVPFRTSSVMPGAMTIDHQTANSEVLNIAPTTLSPSVRERIFVYLHGHLMMQDCQAQLIAGFCGGVFR